MVRKADGVLRSTASTWECFASCPNVLASAVTHYRIKWSASNYCPQHLGIFWMLQALAHQCLGEGVRWGMPRGSGTRQDPEQMCWGSRCWSSDTWQRFVLARATYVLQAVPNLRYSWCLTRGKSVLSAGRRYRNTSATQVSLCAGEPQQRCPIDVSVWAGGEQKQTGFCGICQAHGVNQSRESTSTPRKTSQYYHQQARGRNGNAGKCWWCHHEVPLSIKWWCQPAGGVHIHSWASNLGVMVYHWYRPRNAICNPCSDSTRTELTEPVSGGCTQTSKEVSGRRLIPVGPGDFRNTNPGQSVCHCCSLCEPLCKKFKLFCCIFLQCSSPARQHPMISRADRHWEDRKQRLVQVLVGDNLPVMLLKSYQRKEKPEEHWCSSSAEEQAFPAMGCWLEDATGLLSGWIAPKEEREDSALWMQLY